MDRTPRVVQRAPDRAPARALQVFPTGAWDGARSDLKELRFFDPANGGPLADNLGDLPTIRARVRALLRNAPAATGARQAVQMGVIGDGLRIHPRLMRGLLMRRHGLTEEGIDAIEKEMAEVFWAWAGSTSCDIRRERNFRALTTQAFAGAWTDGDVFVIRRHKARPGDVLSLKLQLIEADRLSTPSHLSHDPRIVAGIEYDEDGAPVAYHFEDTHPGDRVMRGHVRTWTRVPALAPDGERRVLHIRNLATEDRIGQIRGIPALAPVIVILRTVSKYSDTELMRNLVASLVAGVIETAEGAASSAPAMAPIDPTREGEVEAHEMRLESGAIYEPPPGKTMTMLTPPGPSANYEPYMGFAMQLFGAAINVPAEVLMRRFTNSYSASRAAVNFAYEAFRVMRAPIEDDYVAPIWDWFLFEASGLGLIDLPGFDTDPVARKAYGTFRLVGPVAPQLDPLKEAVAAETRMDALLSSREEETPNLTGGDWEENLRQLAKERKQIQDAGLDTETSAERIRTEPVQPTAADSGQTDRTDEDEGADDRPAAGPVSGRRRARRRTALSLIASGDE